MSSPPEEGFEIAKVGTIGLLGTVTSISLPDAASLVSIMVGLATFIYVVAKTIFLVIDHRRKSR